MFIGGFSQRDLAIEKFKPFACRRHPLFIGEFRWALSRRLGKRTLKVTVCIIQRFNYLPTSFFVLLEFVSTISKRRAFRESVGHVLTMLLYRIEKRLRFPLKLFR